MIRDKKDNLLIPVIFLEKENIKINDKLLLAVYCALLKDDDQSNPRKGKIIYGQNCKSVSVRTEGLASKAEKIIKEISLTRDGLLRLNFS